MVREQPRKSSEETPMGNVLAVLEQDREASQRRLVKRLLEHRFGLLDPEATELLDKATAIELEVFTDRIYGAHSLADVLTRR